MVDYKQGKHGRVTMAGLCGGAASTGAAQPVPAGPVPGTSMRKLITRLAYTQWQTEHTGLGLSSSDRSRLSASVQLSDLLHILVAASPSANLDMQMLEHDLRDDCMITGKKHPSAEEETPRAPKCPNGHALVSLGTSRDNGWACDARKTPGGCKRGCTDFRQSAGWPRFRCERCDWDLCDMCVAAIGPLPAGTGRSRRALAASMHRT